MARLDAARPGYVRIRRRKNMWMTSGLLASIMCHLMGVLGPYLDQYQVILLFDACKVHLRSCVFTTCATTGAWPAVVPPAMTWLLQVLDGFRSYKACLQGAYQDARAKGVVDVDSFLQCIYRAIEEVLQASSWCHAFEQNGFGAIRANVSSNMERTCCTIDS